MTHKGWRVVKPQHNQSYCDSKTELGISFLFAFEAGALNIVTSDHLLHYPKEINYLAV